MHSPPKSLIRFFRWYCTDHLSDAVLGDMLELYERRRKKNLVSEGPTGSFSGTSSASFNPLPSKEKEIHHLKIILPCWRII